MSGNLCPIYIRALDPQSIKNLPPDVYGLLKAMAENIALHKAQSGIAVPVTQQGGTVWRRVAQAAASPEAERAAAAFANTASSLTSISDNVPSVDVNGKVDDALKKVDNLVDDKKNFALDQIYFAQGPVKVNGVDVVPNGGLPTLFVPSDAG